MLNTTDVYEMELKAYEDALANYEKSVTENPTIAFLLAKPEKPTLRAVSPYWSMRGVVTGSRRKWK